LTKHSRPTYNDRSGFLTRKSVSWNTFETGSRAGRAGTFTIKPGQTGGATYVLPLWCAREWA
jgi:hypothetical protein